MPATRGAGAPSNYRWWLVAALWLVCLLNYADRQAIFSVFPLLKAEFGLSDLELGVVGSAFLWVYAIAGPLAGFAGDRFSRKWLILGGLLFWSLVTVATALSRTYFQLVLWRALEGFGEAFYFPASMSLISAYHGNATRSRAMALHQSSVYAGTIAGGALSGAIAQAYGWRLSFFGFGGAGILVAAALTCFLREPVRGAGEERVPAFRALWPALRELIRNRTATLLAAVFVGANFVAMIFLTWLPTYLFRKFGMTLSTAGWNATASLQIASVAGVLVGGALADRAARRHRFGRMRVQAIALLAGTPFLFLTGWTLRVDVLIAAMIGFGFCKGIYDGNLWASLHDAVPPRLRATSVGVMNSLGFLGGGIAPVAIGAGAARFGMGACLSASSLVYFVIGLAMWRARPAKDV